MTVYDAHRPSLARFNGDVILLSTPDGKRGEFYHAISEANAGSRTTARDGCERISMEFLEPNAPLEGPLTNKDSRF